MQKLPHQEQSAQKKQHIRIGGVEPKTSPRRYGQHLEPGILYEADLAPIEGVEFGISNHYQHQRRLDEQ